MAEPGRHAAAISVGAFNGAMPPIAETLHADGFYALLLQVAGGSRLRWTPLPPDTPLLASAYERLARTLWTPTLFNLSEVK